MLTHNLMAFWISSEKGMVGACSAREGGGEERRIRGVGGET